MTGGRWSETHDDKTVAGGPWPVVGDRSHTWAKRWLVVGVTREQNGGWLPEPATDYRSLVTDHRPPATNHGPPATGHKL